MAPNPPASLPAHVRPLTVGDPAEIGGHRLIGRLGGSTMGVVYAAVSPDGEAVALRVAHAEWVPAADPDRTITLLRRSVGVCAVGVNASGTFRGRPWASVQYLPGPDLARCVREDGSLPEPALLVLAAGTAEALTSVHAAGVPHGDVKPGNVVLTPEGPRLVDHGIARRVDDADSLTTAGSVGWLAPERYAGALPDTASDVFSWACLVVFAATGHAPFGTDAAPPEAARRAREDTVDLADVPEGLRPLLARALSADPGGRPAAEEAYLECLVLAGVEDSATPDVWADRLRALVRAHWPRVDADRGQPAAWISSALHMAEREAEAAGSEASPRWGLRARGRGTRDRATGAVRDGGTGEREPGPRATSGQAADGQATGKRANGGRSRGRRRARAGRRLPVLAVAAAVLLAVSVGGGSLLLNALSGESGTTTADSGSGTDRAAAGDRPTGPLGGTELVSASLDTLLAADSFELTLLTHAGNGEGHGQPLPTGTDPTLFDRVLYQAGPPEALRWTSTVSGARTSDLLMVDGDLLRAENSAWNATPTWYAAEPGLTEEVFSPAEVVAPLVRAVEEGTVTGEEEVVLAAPPPAQDAFGHLGGEAPDGVPAIRVAGTFPAGGGPGEAATAFVLVATEDGVPLSFATEGAGGGPLNGRPVPEGVPVSFLDPAAPEPERWYTRYTFVELGGAPDPGVPDPGQVRPAAPAPVGD
ncbi:serine/threonine-protein kinase [Nocardiopsis sp. HUAS JQ3]|uniref:serine/threonine protein kinase n=1 Tax=Nocardiopsis sp. HUAS JQ3 TaxID=3061629 RepID=UPI0023A98D8C|nr:serine/threonine-protein kinase [Nocardiopsis sp. HUAS JQ3]WDZ92221.1 serine/threonine-protein kinase [Nocardiopsis sp. HUAS JQ3]